MIVLSKVTKRFGPKILFEDVSVQFDPGKRYGVTGANGAGKSTLLEMLAGQDDWDAGSIDIPRGLKLGVLEQNHFAYDGYSAESEAASLLVGLGIPTEKHSDPMRTLPAGYKLRVLLAKVLFGRPDVALL